MPPRAKWESWVQVGILLVGLAGFEYSHHQDDVQSATAMEHRITMLEQARADEDVNRKEMLHELEMIRGELEGYAALSGKNVTAGGR